MTYLLVAGLTAFAVCAVLLNEGEHRRRRRARAAAHPAGSEPTTVDLRHEPARPTATREPGNRRLPVGEFVFGALYVSGEQPIPFATLAERAAGSGLDVSQVLAWLERAEEGGLIERVVEADEETGEQREPAVRLTTAGMDVARNNRRSARRRARSQVVTDR